MTFRNAVLGVALIPLACSAAPQENFSAEMLRRIQAAMPDARLSLKQDEPLVIVQRKSGEREEGEINLHRIHNYCAHAAASDCEAAKAEFVTKISQKLPEMTPASLRLVVRDQQYLEYLNNNGKGGPSAWGVFEPIGEDLYAVLASDSDNAIRIVGNKDLGELGLTRQQAWTFARKQTEERLPKIPTAQQLAEAPVAFEAEEYLASLLIDRDSWSRLSQAVGPDLFVTAVSDQFVFVAMRPDGASFDEFKKVVANDCAAQQRCVSPNIYRFRGGKWMIAR